MLITKKESKQLRYFARANYKSDCQGKESEKGKVKHRVFPCFDLSYDETNVDKGMVELTNILIGETPFNGTYEGLMARLREILDNPKEPQQEASVEQHYEPCLLHGPDCTQEPLPPGPPIVQRLKESETGKNFENMAAAVSELAHPEMKVVKSEIKDLSEDGTLTIDVQAVMSNPVDKVNVEIKPVGDHVEISPVVEIPAEPVPEVASVSDPFGEITGTVNPTWSSGEENVKPLHDIHVEAAVEKIHEDFETVLQGAKETGTPVITAVQKPAIHVDSAADGTQDVSAAVDTSEPPAEPKPKKMSRGELNDLRIRCATMKLAKFYGEKPDTPIGDILKHFPEATDKLNEFFMDDKIKPYTIDDASIKEAYPEEYALCNG